MSRRGVSWMVSSFLGLQIEAKKLVALPKWRLTLCLILVIPGMKKPVKIILALSEATYPYLGVVLK